MKYINPSTETIQHSLSGGTPINYATIGSAKVVVDKTFDAETFVIVTPGPEGQDILIVDTTDVMLTSAPIVIDDGTYYYMQFEATLAVMVESASSYFLLQQVITFNANLGLLSNITPPAQTALPLVTLSAVNDGFTANSVTSNVTIDTFSIQVGELKSVKVVLNVNDAIDYPIFTDD